MHRRRRHDIPSVSAEIHARRQPHLVADETARMGKVQMTAAATGQALDGQRQALMLALEVFQGNVAAMPHIDIDHDQAGDGPGDYADACFGPCAEPAERFSLTRTPTL